MRGLAVGLVLAALCAGCEPGAPARPSWAAGVWHGALSYEHDVRRHPLRIGFDDSTFVYPDRACWGRMRPDSTSETLVRVRFVPDTAAVCGELAGGIAEIRSLEDGPTLHLQYWPEGEPKLFLARLERAIPPVAETTPSTRRD